MKYLSSDNCIYKLSLGYNLLNSFLITVTFYVNSGQFPVWSYPNFTPDCGKYHSTKPRKKKKKLQFVRAYFIQNCLYLFNPRTDYLSPTMKRSLVTFFLWETQTRRSWVYSASHKGSKTSQRNCIREHSHEYWCQCDKQEN